MSVARKTPKFAENNKLNGLDNFAKRQSKSSSRILNTSDKENLTSFGNGIPRPERSKVKQYENNDNVQDDMQMNRTVKPSMMRGQQLKMRKQAIPRARENILMDKQENFDDDDEMRGQEQEGDDNADETMIYRKQQQTTDKVLQRRNSRRSIKPNQDDSLNLSEITNVYQNQDFTADSFVLGRQSATNKRSTSSGLDISDISQNERQSIKQNRQQQQQQSSQPPLTTKQRIQNDKRRLSSSSTSSRPENSTSLQQLPSYPSSTKSHQSNLKQELRNNVERVRSIKRDQRQIDYPDSTSECSEALTSFSRRTSYSNLPTSVDRETIGSFSDVDRMRMAGQKRKVEAKTKIDFINSMFDELGIDGQEQPRPAMKPKKPEILDNSDSDDNEPYQQRYKNDFRKKSSAKSSQSESHTRTAAAPHPKPKRIQKPIVEEEDDEEYEENVQNDRRQQKYNIGYEEEIQEDKFEQLRRRQKQIKAEKSKNISSFQAQKAAQQPSQKLKYYKNQKQSYVDEEEEDEPEEQEVYEQSREITNYKKAREAKKANQSAKKKYKKLQLNDLSDSDYDEKNEIEEDYHETQQRRVQQQRAENKRLLEERVQSSKSIKSNLQQQQQLKQQQLLPRQPQSSAKKSTLKKSDSYKQITQQFEPQSSQKMSKIALVSQQFDEENEQEQDYFNQTQKSKSSSQARQKVSSFDEEFTKPVKKAPSKSKKSSAQAKNEEKPSSKTQKSKKNKKSQHNEESLGHKMTFNTSTFFNDEDEELADRDPISYYYNKSISSNFNVNTPSSEANTKIPITKKPKKHKREMSIELSPGKLDDISSNQTTNKTSSSSKFSNLTSTTKLEDLLPPSGRTNETPASSYGKGVMNKIPFRDHPIHVDINSQQPTSFKKKPQSSKASISGTSVNKNSATKELKRPPLPHHSKRQEEEEEEQLCSDQQYEEEQSEIYERQNTTSSNTMTLSSAKKPTRSLSQSNLSNRNYVQQNKQVTDSGRKIHKSYEKILMNFDQNIKPLLNSMNKQTSSSSIRCRSPSSSGMLNRSPSQGSLMRSPSRGAQSPLVKSPSKKLFKSPGGSNLKKSSSQNRMGMSSGSGWKQSSPMNKPNKSSFEQSQSGFMNQMSNMQKFYAEINNLTFKITEAASAMETTLQQLHEYKNVESSSRQHLGSARKTNKNHEQQQSFARGYNQSQEEEYYQKRNQHEQHDYNDYDQEEGDEEYYEDEQDHQRQYY